ncbi:S-layer homology domain-containing protein [Paenibacillus endoradicis]|uniref:S-layer homology domain-containing protein n=1 Tax=Paenibacillus endoradicis TaxID=2972487 RepID=UPI002159785A|nr:S-layer homology domain-containing protein [Paenibacillus endoradicis]MCR8657245.1 S-layer homology domain-containing protein [Paenibacillus endoradicis]
MLIKALNKKMLLSIFVAVLLIISYVSIGQLANAAEGVTSNGNSNLVSTIDPTNLANGNYYIDYTVLYAEEDKTSMSTQYLVSPALLKVDDNKKTISFTVLQSKEIVGLKLNGNEGNVSNNNSDNNTRVVTFEIGNLTDIHKGWISINWVIETIDFKYIHEYDIRFKFLTESIKAVAVDAPVPTKDGKVGFPSGLDGDSGSSNTDSETGNPKDDTTVEEPEQEPTVTSFKDIEGHWAKAAIENAVQLSIANGYSDGTFKPNAVINRSQFAVMLSRALKLSAANSSSLFADQEAIPTWASVHINAVVDAGLMGGYSDNTFRGNNNITRTEMAVIIARAAKLEVNKAPSVTFADSANIPTWAQQEVEAAVQAGLISGKGNNRFEPAASATRAEALTIILRLLHTSS